MRILLAEDENSLYISPIPREALRFRGNFEQNFAQHFVEKVSPITSLKLFENIVKIPQI